MKFAQNHILHFIIFFLLISLSSCKYSGVNYKYSTTDEVLIEMNMTDTASVFDLYIAYRISKDYDKDSITLLFETISPSNVKYSDVIYLPSSFAEIQRYLIFFPEKEENVKIRSGRAHDDIEWKYHKDIIPLELGIWKISLKNINKDENLIGLGVHYNERER